MISVEYAHIYADKPLSSEQVESIERLPDLSGEEAQFVVMLDDYNAPSYAGQAMDLGFTLERCGKEPDAIYRESSLVGAAAALLAQLPARESRQIHKWVRKKGKFPCSLLTAAWYAMRLGKIPAHPDSYRGRIIEPADRLVNVLPVYYEANERKAFELLDDSFAVDSHTIEGIFYPEPMPVHG